MFIVGTLKTPKCNPSISMIFFTLLISYGEENAANEHCLGICTLFVSRKDNEEREFGITGNCLLAGAYLDGRRTPL